MLVKYINKNKMGTQESRQSASAYRFEFNGLDEYNNNNSRESIAMDIFDSVFSHSLRNADSPRTSLYYLDGFAHGFVNPDRDFDFEQYHELENYLNIIKNHYMVGYWRGVELRESRNRTTETEEEEA